MKDPTQKTWLTNREKALVPIATAVAPVAADHFRTGLSVVYKDGFMDALDNQARMYPGALDWPDMYRRMPRFKRVLDFGSPNQRALASGLALHHPATRAEALASWGNAEHVEEHFGFELEEPGSRIYRCWSLLGRLLAWNDRDLRLHKYLEEWFSMFWVRFALSSIRTQWGDRSLATGARSQGRYDRLFDDYAASLAFGTQFVFRQGIDKSWLRNDEVIAFRAMIGSLRESAAVVRDVLLLSSLNNDSATDRLIALAPKWPTLAVTWYLRTAQGLAVWADNPALGPDGDDIPNSNTPGIAALGWDAVTGDVWALPPPSSDHVRQKRIVESVTPVDSRGRLWPLESTESVPTSLTYLQSGAGRPILSLTHDLPVHGKIAYLVYHDTSGFRRVV